MSQKSLSKMLKGITALTLLLCVCLYFAAIPLVGRRLAIGEFSGYFWPWLLFLWGTALPVFAGLALLWKICCEIQANRAFCAANANRLALISGLAVGDVLYFFAGSVLLLLVNKSHPSVLLASLLVDFVGIAASILAALLSRLVRRAAELQEENALTI